VSQRITLAYDAIDDVKTLFKEYAVTAKADFCFQDFDRELLTLPGSYDLPDGRIYTPMTAVRQPDVYLCVF
jgi:hypothetical protein